MTGGAQPQEQDRLPCLRAEATRQLGRVRGDVPSPQPGQESSPGPEPALFGIVLLKTGVFSQAMLEGQQPLAAKTAFPATLFS